MAENRLSSSLGFTPSGPRTDIKITTLTIVVAAIFLFLTVIFVFLLYFYAKYYWGSRPPRPRPRRRHLPHFIFSAGNPSVPNRGLDPSVLSSLPITLYKPSDFNEGIECAVCLSELAAGEEARLLPKCGHGFHLECIDLWFQSNSTCPICRCAVEVYGNRSDEPTDLPANVLFWGNRNRVDSGEGNSGSSERVLVISIPVRSTEGFLSASGSPLEEKRSPATPKMWSFRRILSRGKMVGGSSSSSPRVCDIEQGMVGSGAEIGEGSSS